MSRRQMKHALSWSGKPMDGVPLMLRMETQPNSGTGLRRTRRIVTRFSENLALALTRSTYACLKTGYWL
jgi:hypothetical protein